MTSYAASMILSYGTEALEIEDSRVNHRLRKTVALLQAAGYEWTSRGHAEDCKRHPDRLSRVCFSYRDGVVCTCGRDQQPGEWKLAPSKDAINAAWTLACASIVEHAAVHHRAIAQRRHDAAQAV